MTPGQTATIDAGRTPLRRHATRACGATLRVNAAVATGSAMCSERLSGQLTELVAAGVPVALTIAGLDRVNATDQLTAVCQNIRDAFDQAELDSRQLEVSVAAGAVPPLVAWQIRQALLRDGILNVVLEPGVMQVDSAAGANKAFWLDVWQLRDTGVRTAFWPTVRSACPLLSPEPATVVVPRLGLQAPAHSAWLFRDVNLGAFADDAGRVNLPRLAAVLEYLIAAAERAYDTVAFATSTMQYDAWYNRRIAVCLSGIGDVARRRGLNPDDHHTVVTLGKLLGKIRSIIETCSRSLLRANDDLPSVAATNPCLHLRNSARVSCWHQRWRDALQRHALRHRNLLVISPWSLFPEGDADIRYANLLPLLAHADACEFRREVSIDAWSARQLRYFHQRAWAICERVSRSMVVAEQP